MTNCDSSRRSWIFGFGMIVFCCTIVQTFSQWTTDSGVNTPVCVNAAIKAMPEIVLDGGGGAIVSWIGSGTARARRIRYDGMPLWDSDGIILNPSPSLPALDNLRSLPDQIGGAFVFWRGPGTGQIAGSLINQHVDSVGTTEFHFGGGEGLSSGYDIATDQNGALLWTLHFHVPGSSLLDEIIKTNKGIVTRTQSTFVSNPRLVSDGVGGLIVVWESSIPGSIRTHLRVQRMMSNGVHRWARSHRYSRQSMECADSESNSRRQHYLLVR
jgi:hypothetical protein